ncbi:MAG: TonB-dependent receptor [Rhodothermales bacterium]|nr:TonB-dependent receptor [Rhodothermales bacterium]MBO6778073.1 TonB-dependent receptor [Rhodothermales bacterium]
MQRIAAVPLTAIWALSLVFAVQLRAQTTTLSGTVLDADSGETLPYASVRIDSLSLGAATNLDGRFALLGVPEGRHTLSVSHIGYQTLDLVVEAVDGMRPIEINLQPRTGELDEVLVTAEQYEMMRTSGAISQITVSPRELAALPSVGEVDIFRSLQLLPGISGTNEGSSGLYVRGGTPDQNLVLLDGMTVYHVDHFFGFFSAFNADAIKDVQVYKGGFPASYGGRTSSVVDLTGKSGANDLRAAVGVNLLSASSVIEAPLGSRATVLVSARRSYTDVLQTGIYTSIFETLTGEETTPEPAAPGGGRRPGGAFNAAFTGPGQAVVQPDFYFYDLNAKVTVRPTDRDVIAMSLYGGQDNLDESRFTSNEIGNGTIGARLDNDIFDVTSWGNQGISGKWSRQWNSKLYSNAMLSYTEYFSESLRNSLLERFPLDADTVAFSRELSSLEDNSLSDATLRIDNELAVSGAHRLGFGAQLTGTDVGYRLTRNDTLSILDADQQSRLLAMYVQDTWSPSDRVRLIAGVRVVNHDLTDETVVEPRASARIALSERIRLKAGIGRYNQFVARVVNENVTEGARDFWLLADGQDVGVQRSTHYLAGVAYETPNWLLDVEAYHKDLTGLSEFTLRFRRGEADFEASDLFFQGTGTARGLEFLLQRKFGPTTGWLSYTLAEVEHTFPGLNDGKPFPALHDQRHELKVVQSSRINERWNVAATFTLATGKPYTTPESEYAITLLDGSEQTYIHVGQKNGVRLPAYHRLDASAHYRFPVGSSTVDFGVSIFNLYNRQNVWYRQFDLSQSPFVTTDVSFLGLTPNLSVRVEL